MIRVYNTLTGKKEEFVPLMPGKVGMYTCGVTVYDKCHIGHGRSVYVFETIRRYLQYRGFDVTMVRNITDIDDKILAKAQNVAARESIEIGAAWQRVIDVNIAGYYDDLKKLGVAVADREPRATEYVDKIISFVQALIDKEFAYESNGSVYFRVRRYQERCNCYGELSGKKIDDLYAGVRKGEDPDKEDPLDFALWKAKKEGEVGWTSPWGEGRPGWHIECSVMATDILGATFDIHGGGKDLVFPHHENEIAQSRAKTGVEFARYWLHHGLITIENQKMSKSLGNFTTLSDALASMPADVLKIMYLSAHYRSPLDFSEAKLTEAKRVYERLSILVTKLDAYEPVSVTNVTLLKLRDAFVEYMDDDFNTPAGFSVMFELLTAVNTHDENDTAFFGQARQLKDEMFSIFGLECRTTTQAVGLSDVEIEAKIEDRKIAKKNKDFAKADAIRAELLEKGIVLEDKPGGVTEWRVKV
jgi:cysteinyl-tRNA synthetase